MLTRVRSAVDIPATETSAMETTINKRNMQEKIILDESVRRMYIADPQLYWTSLALSLRPGKLQRTGCSFAKY